MPYHFDSALDVAQQARDLGRAAVANAERDLQSAQAHLLTAKRNGYTTIAKHEAAIEAADAQLTTANAALRDLQATLDALTARYQALRDARHAAEDAALRAEYASAGMFLRIDRWSGVRDLNVRVTISAEENAYSSDSVTVSSGDVDYRTDIEATVREGKPVLRTIFKPARVSTYSLNDTVAVARKQITLMTIACSVADYLDAHLIDRLNGLQCDLGALDTPEMVPAN